MISDIIVIGGGLAGSTAAFHLSRYGYDVLILEKEKFPHHKVCGEFLSPETASYLEEMGLNLEELGASPITGLQLHAPHFQTRIPLLQKAKSLSRLRLDEACLRKAEQAGAKIERGVLVTHFQPENSHFRVQTSQGVFQGKALFLASGKQDIKKFQERHGKENSAIGFKLHLDLSSSSRKNLGQDVALYFYRGGYAGVSLVEDKQANLCFIIDKKIFQKQGNRFDATLTYLQEQNHSLKTILRESVSSFDKPLATANVPYGYLHPSEAMSSEKEPMQNIYSLGDQFAVIPSLTGAGMAIAMFTGKKAAEGYHQEQLGGKSRYADECRQTIRPSMTLSYPLHHFCRRPLFADLCTLSLKIFPTILRSIIERTRIES